MLTITDGAQLARALTLPLDPRLKRLLRLRCDQLGGEIAGIARFVVVGPRDRPAWLEEALGFSPLQNPGDGTWHGDPGFTPGWEWIEDHGFCWELCFVMTDDGFAHVVLVENRPGVSRELVELCRAHAAQHA